MASLTNHIVEKYITGPMTPDMDRYAIVADSFSKLSKELWAAEIIKF